MSYKFVDAMLDDGNWKLTENGAYAKSTTGNSLLDLFATIGALRKRDENDILSSFAKAFNEDNLLALKMSFYARNVRGGLGERRTARVIWKLLANVVPDVMRKNLYLVPVFGRWDDLYEFVDTPLEEYIWSIIAWQWDEDYLNLRHGNSVSIMAKWLKSVNTSSKESSRLGRLTAKNLGMTEREYRKKLVALRNQIDVVEQKMSANQWSKINYEHVPSKAMNKYRKAFPKHDQERFSYYMENVSKGTAKIHSGTLFPYDIMEKVLRGEYNQVLEEQWKALPNYIGDDENNMLVVADVSGSMSMGGVRPLATSVGLAIYFAERNHGPFKNVFMTFSEHSDFVKLEGQTLYEKAHNARNTQWDMNTNIESAFNKILQVAIENNLSQDDLPKALLIISDMEFDQASLSYGRKTYFEILKAKYQQRGYRLPKIVFWNVNARQDTFHATMRDGMEVILCSGQSTSTFNTLIKGIEMNAYEMMVATLNDPMYKEISL
jgi:Domain of unknown function (DUF2828)